MKTQPPGRPASRHRKLKAGLPPLAAACAALLLALGQANDTNAAQRARAEMAPAASAADPTRTLRSLIGDAGCDSDVQCRTIAVGHQACGGPSRFVAWSEKRTELAAISAAVADIDRADGAAVTGGRMSTCSTVLDPGAYCVRESTHSEVQDSSGSAGICRLRRLHGTAASLPDR